MLTTQVFVWSNSVVANGTEKNTCSSRNPNHPDPPWPDVRCHTILRNQRCTRFGQSTPHLTRRDTQPLPFLLQTNIQKKTQLPNYLWRRYVRSSAGYFYYFFEGRTSCASFGLLQYSTGIKEEHLWIPLNSTQKKNINGQPGMLHSVTSTTSPQRGRTTQICLRSSSGLKDTQLT